MIQKEVHTKPVTLQFGYLIQTVFYVWSKKWVKILLIFQHYLHIIWVTNIS